MCIKLTSKTLNPHAKEWEPTPKQYRRPLPPPPPQPAAFHPAPPPHYYPNYNINLPVLYLVPFPATLEVTPRKAKIMEKMVAGSELKSPKCPPAGIRRAYPPRLLRLRKFYRVDNPPQKLEWRPKESVQANYKVSGERGATGLIPPPPPFSGRRCSRPQNTTVMIKNIPNQLRRHFMLSFLDDYCRTHDLEYDFLYLPMDFRKKDNLGYAFVNFTTSVAAQKFKQTLQGYKWAKFYCHGRLFNSKKVCDITWARIQGLKALAEKFKRSSFLCDRLDYLPVILDPPRNGYDPNPSAPVILGSLHQQALKE